MTDEKDDMDEDEKNAEEEPNEDEVDQEEMAREMSKMMTSVKDMGLYNISMTATQAWHHLGLVPMPGTEEPNVDLDQAKMAIDLLEANIKVLSEYLEDDMKKQLKQTLMDLQLNYMNKSKSDNKD